MAPCEVVGGLLEGLPHPLLKVSRDVKDYGGRELPGKEKDLCPLPPSEDLVAGPCGPQT